MRGRLDAAFEADIRARIEKSRAAIDTDTITRRMCGFVTATPSALRENPELFMSKEQLKAAEILLKKTMPDLKQVELTGEGGGPVQTITRVELVGMTSGNSANPAPAETDPGI